MNRSSWCALVATSLLCGSIVNAQQSSAPRNDSAIAGCYRLSLGPWSRDANSGPALATTVFRLDTLALDDGTPGNLVVKRIEPLEVLYPSDSRVSHQRPMSWRREGADSVVIVLWSTGTEAELFMGHRSGRVLEGVVRRTNDAIPVDPKTYKIQWNGWPFAAASAVRISCP